MGLKSCQADVVIGAGPGEIGQGRCLRGGEGGGEGGGDVREQRLEGGRGRSYRTLACFTGVGPDFVGVGVVFSRATSMVMASRWSLEMYINEDGVGLEGTLSKYPHGNEPECSSSSRRLLVCISAAVCNF